MDIESLLECHCGELVIWLFDLRQFYMESLQASSKTLILSLSGHAKNSFATFANIMKHRVDAVKMLSMLSKVLNEMGWQFR